MKTDLITMILAVAATEFEMKPFVESIGSTPCRTLVSGVGLVESCLRLTRYLEDTRENLSMVMNFGVGGAFINSSEKRQAVLLGLCLAETEVFGDLGICYPMRIDDLTGDLCPQKFFHLNSDLRKAAEQVLQHHDIKYYSGNFITVNSVSGTKTRGELLRRKHTGLCENMEGAAIARVCQDFSLPLLQLRCISNFVEDRDAKKWKMQQACDKSGSIAALIIKEFENHYGSP